MMFDDHYITTNDGLRLNIRVYGDGKATPLFCIPGLTRNAADFEELAPTLASKHRRVFVISLRGRSLSDYAADFRTYHPLVYRDDVLTALDTLKINRAIFIGTSLGGITSMLINHQKPSTVAGVVLNDIGPDLAPEGLARIASYVGQVKKSAMPLDEAILRIKAINEIAFPNRDDAFWATFARRTFKQNAAGWSLDYDPAIARGFTEGDPPPDLSDPFESLKNTPTLLVRGALSDLLTIEIVEKMRLTYPSFDYCEVPNTGHAPTLAEPEALNAIKEFVSSCT